MVHYNLYVGAEVGLEQTSYTVNEADGVQQVCIIFTQLGTDELECNVTVSLMAISQGKTGKYCSMLNFHSTALPYHIIHCKFLFIFILPS